ncbi:MAG TPA: hypothetical protein VLC09_02440 [Polyangiaceae bacterium]|nr:hypothetical protein [Polyangiaceae bacterium]
MMRRLARWSGARYLAGLALLLCVFFGLEPTARAQGFETGPGNSRLSTLGSAPGTRWRFGAERWFVASRVDVGFFFLRPRVSVGYGQPHFSWVGVDAVPIVSTSAIGGYMGLRVEKNFFEVRSGMLHQYSYNRSFLPQQDSYGRRDIDILDGPRAQYWLWDSELELYAPLGPIKLRSDTQLIYATGFPEAHDLYLDTMWVVIGSGVTVRQRLGFEFFLRGTNIGVTPAVEVVWLDERQVGIVRAGVQLRWLLTDELQIRTSILPVVKSPDYLGRASGDVLEVTLRWLWASD